MRLPATLRAVPRRLAHPWILLLTLGMLAFRVASLAAHEFQPAHPWLSMFQSWFTRVTIHLDDPFGIWNLLDRSLLLVYLFGFSALPWQWTGDDRPMAPLWRGAFQAFGLYVLLGLPTALLHSHLPVALRFHSGEVPLVERFVILVMRSGLPILLGYLLARQEAHRNDKLEAESRMAAARWSLLKAQMSPHVLLNSLTGLAELVRVDPQAARKGLEDLAAIHGRLMQAGEADFGTLGQERELLDQYLRLERMRMGDKVEVRWDWEEGLDGLRAMPLLLQPLVENALKFGPGSDPGGGVVTLEGRREGDRLRFRIGNTQSRRPARSGTGLGLRNLRARLELAYGPGARLTLNTEAEWTYAVLEVPMKEAL